MFDVKALANEAEDEVKKEQLTLAKAKIKQKLREKAQAEKILRNIDRELEDLYVEISEDNQ